MLARVYSDTFYNDFQLDRLIHLRFAHLSELLGMLWTLTRTKCGNRKPRPLAEDTSPSAAKETGLSVMLDHDSKR